MQNRVQTPDVSFTEIEAATVPDNDVRSCTKGLSCSLGKCVQKMAAPVEQLDMLNKSKKSFCFDLVISCNGYDYLGP